MLDGVTVTKDSTPSKFKYVLYDLINDLH